MDYTELAMKLMENMFMLQKGKKQQEMSKSVHGETFVLAYLSMRKGDVLPSEISSQMSISSARIAATLGNLEKKNLIIRQIDRNDRRRILVTLTDHGKEVAEQQRTEVMGNVIHMLESLGEHDAQEHVRIMGRLAQMEANN
ncbi:MAG: transcriptional regulator [Mobilitalea sp.]